MQYDVILISKKKNNNFKFLLAYINEKIILLINHDI